jgi:hypothetical protein
MSREGELSLFNEGRSKPATVSSESEDSGIIESGPGCSGELGGGEVELVCGKVAEDGGSDELSSDCSLSKGSPPDEGASRGAESLEDGGGGEDGGSDESSSERSLSEGSSSDEEASGGRNDGRWR